MKYLSMNMRLLLRNRKWIWN